MGYRSFVITVLATVLTLIIAFSSVSAATVPSPDEKPTIPPDSSRKYGVVGLRPGTDFQLTTSGISAPPGAEPGRAVGIEELRQVGLRLQPLFSRPRAELTADRIAAAAESDFQPPDLGRWLRFEVPAGMTMEQALARLRALPVVETAYAWPKAVPASAGASVTPSFVSKQGYLEGIPTGLGIKEIWKFNGGKGQNVLIADVEGDWNVKHEDLARAKAKNIDGELAGGVWYPHGTAVLGILVGAKNGFGITGIAHRARVKMFSIYRQVDDGPLLDNVPDAINRAAAALSPGDVILLEVQYSGLKRSSDYIPVEYFDADFEAIRAATAKGIVVVEAAGNGSQNLDAKRYGDAFNRKVRGDSRAIMVGAGAPPDSYHLDRARLLFSNYGSRVDIQCWGERVTTSGYGDLYSSGGVNYHYTDSFNGTSSASALTAASVACLQGIARNALGKPLKPRKLRKILIKTGLPQQGNTKQHIGPRPDLEKAAQKIVDMAK